MVIRYLSAALREPRMACEFPLAILRDDVRARQSIMHGYVIKRNLDQLLPVWVSLNSTDHLYKDAGILSDDKTAGYSHEEPADREKGLDERVVWRVDHLTMMRKGNS